MYKHVFKPLKKIGISTAIFCMLGVTAVHADYPNRTIKVVVPFSPGGSTDQIGRYVAKHLSEDLGVNAIVENRPGGGGNVGNTHVARAKADGYTLLIGGTDVATGHLLYKELPFDPINDLELVGLVTEFPFLLITPKEGGATTVEELVEYAKNNPDGVSYASAGVGNSLHLAGEIFNKATGLETLVHVPYSGSTEALNAVVSGQVEMMFDTAITAAPQVTGGNANAIGALSKQRLPQFPDVPTMTEAGYPEFEDLLSTWSWKGVFTPTGTPEDVVQTLQVSLNKLKDSAEFKEQMERSLTLVADKQDSEDAQSFMESQREGWARVIEAANIEPM